MDKSNKDQRETSWEDVSSWYDSLTSQEGHYYHQHVVIPGVLKLLELEKIPQTSLLDLGCGQGVLGRAIPENVRYHGVDISPSFLAQARSYNKRKNQKYTEGDITKPLPIKDEVFTHAASILALQNIEKPVVALKEAGKFLAPSGKLVIVMNHPCFRIPRQSSWGIDQQKKIQYRRLDLYLSPLKIPIQTHPSKKEASSSTWSFHYPLSAYFQFLAEAQFVVTDVQEWISPKQSTGKNAKMENRARAEFPLFLAIKAEKRSV